MELIFVSSDRLTPSQRQRVNGLQKECFSHVGREEIQECFIAEGFGRVLAYEDRSMVGQVELFSRRVSFDGKRVSLGGLGGTCVTASARNRGIGKEMVKKGLKVLRQRKCDVACLSADIKNHPSGGLYHQLGFRVMKRKISFQDAHGKTRYDGGEMFVKVCPDDIYDFIMNGKKTFHLGRGYW